MNEEKYIVPLTNTTLSEEIRERIRGFDNEEQYFVQKLSFGIARIGAAFIPKP